LTKRLKRAAHRERARRLLAMYAMSAFVLLVLLAPFVLALLIWRE
jgi:hypothetical protein